MSPSSISAGLVVLTVNVRLPTEVLTVAGKVEKDASKGLVLSRLVKLYLPFLRSILMRMVLVILPKLSGSKSTLMG